MGQDVIKKLDIIISSHADVAGIDKFKGAMTPLKESIMKVSKSADGSEQSYVRMSNALIKTITAMKGFVGGATSAKDKQERL